jgi:hypothetical protein
LLDVRFPPLPGTADGSLATPVQLAFQNLPDMTAMILDAEVTLDDEAATLSRVHRPLG